jgi:hypothetical protein
MRDLPPLFRFTQYGKTSMRPCQTGFQFVSKGDLCLKGLDKAFFVGYTCYKMHKLSKSLKSIPFGRFQEEGRKGR